MAYPVSQEIVDKIIASIDKRLLLFGSDGLVYETYTEIQVCRSNAGFYAGRLFVNEEGFTYPGSKESDYRMTREEVENLIKEFESGDLRNYRFREENTLMYRSFKIEIGEADNGSKTTPQD
jgi:hypothetical protein